MNPLDRERHLRMCENLSQLIASEGYTFALNELKLRLQNSWSQTLLDESSKRDELYRQFNAVTLLDQQLTRLANEFRSIEIDRKAQIEQEKQAHG